MGVGIGRQGCMGVGIGRQGVHEWGHGKAGGAWVGVWEGRWWEQDS
jgi:hypothetical protein